MEPSKHFDEHIRRTLENLERSYDPGSWAMLEQRLDQAAMEEVDDLFKEKLGGLENAIPPSNWAALEQMIEADEATEIIENEANIDNLAYEKLNNLEVPYTSHHWALMAKRLEEEFSLRHKLYRYKVAEISLMALLLLTVIRFMPYVESLLPGQEDHPEKVEQPQLQPTTPVPAIENENNAQPVLPEQPAEKEFGTPAVPIASLPDNVQQSSSSILSDNSSTIGSDVDLMTGSAFNAINARPNIGLVDILSIESINSETAGTPLFEQIVERNLMRSALATPGSFNRSTSPELIASVDNINVKSTFDWELPTLKTPVVKIPSQLRFSIFTSTNLNLVNTPPDQLNVLDTLVPVAPNTTLASGYGGGVLVSWKKGKMEFQTGGIYSFKRYIPNTPVFIFETLNYYVKEDFNGIQLDILQVPFNMNYHFKNSGNWRIYGAAGASGHFITSSVYEIDYRRTPILSAMAPPSSPDDTRSIRQDKEFPSGLLDGGEFQDNFYLTANLGLGIERYVSTKWVVFVQPNYQHYLLSRGVGTNRDKIYAMSLYLGAKFNLK